MELTRLFRRMVFLQAMIAMTASCVAEGHVALFIAAGALGALAWYVMESAPGEEAGLPQVAVRLGLLAAMLNLPYEIFATEGRDLVQAIAHFTLWLQLLLLLGRKTHRDYPPIMVLSLLQMLAASLLGASLVFGILLLVYCVVALFTILLYQLKSVQEHVKERCRRVAPGNVQPQAPPVAGRGHRWQFRLGALVIGAFCAGGGAMAFALMPRHEPLPFFSTLISAETGRHVTGFSPQITLVGAPMSDGSRAPVLTMRIRRDDAAESPARDRHASWLLRGAVVDEYDPVYRSWTSGARGRPYEQYTLRLPDDGLQLLEAPMNTPHYVADITLLASRYRTLFMLYPVSYVQSPDMEILIYSRRDGQLGLAHRNPDTLHYTLHTVIAGPKDLEKLEKVDFDNLVVSSSRMEHYGIRDVPRDSDEHSASQSWPYEDMYAKDWDDKGGEVRELARRVLAAEGIVIESLKFPTTDAVFSNRIARTLEQFLANSGQYSYSLDVPPTKVGDDPIIHFLFEGRRGHCELFASALTAMARSIGLRARIATGYRASEYNEVGDYYVVRDSQAHAWTEIEIAPDVWQTYDASPSADVTRMHNPDGWFRGVQHLYEHLEYTWSQRIMGFNRNAQEEALGQLRRSLDQSQNVFGWLSGPWHWLQDLARQFRSDALTQIVAGMILIFLVIAIISLIHRLIVRRRRLIALQLTCLPRHQRRELARQLRFYLTMLEMLERHGHVRSPWQSPFGFAQQLVSSSPVAAQSSGSHRFQSVVALTERFYEIRFGYRLLNEERRQLIREHLRRLESALTQKT